VFNRKLAYVVSFGTTKWHAMIGLFDRIAKTFVVDKEAKLAKGLFGGLDPVINSAAHGDAVNDNRLVD
jgi:hypothetical protein